MREEQTTGSEVSFSTHNAGMGIASTTTIVGMGRIHQEPIIIGRQAVQAGIRQLKGNRTGCILNSLDEIGVQLKLFLHSTCMLVFMH
mmetsp:Transcript_48849/g.147189  ORF Transcript_48849/g.147189 Transcript_48849/m.147189 type:complete len:87 (+) Transcript_48849:609-869(+)